MKLVNVTELMETKEQVNSVNPAETIDQDLPTLNYISGYWVVSEFLGYYGVHTNQEDEQREHTQRATIHRGGGWVYSRVAC